MNATQELGLMGPAGTSSGHRDSAVVAEPRRADGRVPAGMKLGFISQWFDPERGSAAQASTIARSLSRRGFDVTALTGFPNYPEGRLYPGYRLRPHMVEERDGIEVHRVALVPTHKPSFSSRLVSYASFATSASIAAPAVLAGSDVALVHLTPATSALAGATLRALRGIPFVLHIQDLWPETVISSEFMNSRSARWATAAINGYCDAMYRRASAIAVTSPGMADKVRARGIPAEKIHFAPNWADEAVFTPQPVDETRRRELRLRPFTVMYAGNLGPFQSLDTLLDVARDTKDREDIGYLVVGEGAEAARLDERIRAESLGNVTRLGAQPFNQMASLLALGDLHYVGLVDKPLFQLTVPSKIQATLAVGRPILGNVQGDAARIVTSANAGVCAGPNDVAALAAAVRNYANHPEAARQAGRDARSFYEQHLSEAASAAVLSDLLVAAAEERPAPSRPIPGKGR